jgi:hypothetical protein
MRVREGLTARALVVDPALDTVHALRSLRDRGREIMEVGRKEPLEDRRSADHAH